MDERKKRVAKAPGKLMLAGEYVVVEGLTPALAVAVGRYASVEVMEAGGGAPWTVSSQELRLKKAPLDAVPVMAALMESLKRPGGGEIIIRSDLGVGADKPGLGASAAICVAAMMAFDEGVALQDAIDVHRKAQHGRGSGYDVATSMHGGVSLFTPDEGDEVAQVESVPWPQALHAAVFRASRGAHTVEKLVRMQAWRRHDPQSYEASLDALAAETKAFIKAFQGGQVAKIFEATVHVQEALEALDTAGGLGVFEGGQRQLLALIEECGAFGRTSGAGGGDCAWAFSEDPAVFEAIEKLAPRYGFERLDLEIGVPGASRERD